MRAFAHIDTFRRHYAVHLLVACPWPGRQRWNDLILARCERVLHVPLSLTRDWPTLLRWMRGRLLPRRNPFPGGPAPEWISSSRCRLKSEIRHFARIPFEQVHVFRLYMVPLLDGLGEAVTGWSVQVDVDDLESQTRAAISRLYGQNGNLRMARRLACEARAYAELERQYLPRFDRVFVCSEADRKALRSKVPGIEPLVLPNVVPNGNLRQRKGRRPPFVFMFVGSLTYYPNAEGVQHFCSEIIPILRRRISTDWEFRIVGGGLSWWTARRLRRIPEVRVLGHLPDIRSCYEDADAMVLPLRAGGGTRIKALEAFACGVPVLSTSIGVHGLDVRHGIEVAIADSPESFAEACIQLVEDESFRCGLARHALQRAQRSYHPRCLRHVLLGEGKRSVS